MQKSIPQLLGIVAAIVLLPAIIVFVAAAILYLGLLAAFSVLATSLLWCPRGVRYLVVYSESEVWRHYFQAEVIPHFGKAARVINLSRDGGGRKWWSLDSWIYRHFAGYKNRFPIVFRFVPFGPWSTLRFYEPYMESKKGKPDALRQAFARLDSWKKTEA